ncbi:MAG: biopolymer transporter ExbD [Spirochaetes bacterium]|nr:biopolymer transporter ExbD [Spirochaetota bacterium]MBU0953846.1 biopolymer transporter ExbD [Spirochaetota bacterium]
MKISVRARRRGFAPAAMADIAFLLLIFFITTTSIDEDSNLELPEFQYTRETGFPQTVRLQLDRNDQLLLDGSPGTADTLTRLLQQRYLPAETVIMFEADRDTPYRRIDEVLVALGSAGFERIVLVAQGQTAGGKP